MFDPRQGNRLSFLSRRSLTYGYGMLRLSDAGQGRVGAGIENRLHDIGPSLQDSEGLGNPERVID